MDALAKRGLVEAQRANWDGALEAFEQLRDPPPEVLAYYCAALIHRGRPRDVERLVAQYGSLFWDSPNWLRIATTSEATPDPRCGCADIDEGDEPPDPLMAKEVLWFRDDLFDDEWVFCLDCHQLWRGGTEQGDPAPWCRAEIEWLDDESHWTCGFGANAHPGDVLRDHDRFVRWVVELERREEAFSLP